MTEFYDKQGKIRCASFSALTILCMDTESRRTFSFIQKNEENEFNFGKFIVHSSICNSSQNKLQSESACISFYLTKRVQCNFEWIWNKLVKVWTFFALTNRHIDNDMSPPFVVATFKNLNKWRQVPQIYVINILEKRLYFAWNLVLHPTDSTFEDWMRDRKIWGGQNRVSWSEIEMQKK